MRDHSGGPRPGSSHPAGPAGTVRDWLRAVRAVEATQAERPVPAEPPGMSVPPASLDHMFEELNVRDVETELVG
ncbi:MAG: hypothetical protein L0I24_05420, partial [Pseudonocardia sp.]|nr:hypothetical protein [Pseudonocardia sp.]